MSSRKDSRISAHILHEQTGQFWDTRVPRQSDSLSSMKCLSTIVSCAQRASNAPWLTAGGGSAMEYEGHCIDTTGGELQAQPDGHLQRMAMDCCSCGSTGYPCNITTSHYSPDTWSVWTFNLYQMSDYHAKRMKMMLVCDSAGPHDMGTGWGMRSGRPCSRRRCPTQQIT